METTRFYYCDGAVEEYLREHMNASAENYNDEIRKLINKANHVIRFIMEAYLNYKINKK